MERDEDKMGFKIFKLVLTVVAWHAMLTQGKGKFQAMLDACDEVGPAIDTLKAKGVLPPDVVKQISSE